MCSNRSLVSPKKKRTKILREQFLGVASYFTFGEKDKKVWTKNHIKHIYSSMCSNWSLISPKQKQTKNHSEKFLGVASYFTYGEKR